MWKPANIRSASAGTAAVVAISLGLFACGNASDGPGQAAETAADTSTTTTVEPAAGSEPEPQAGSIEPSIETAGSPIDDLRVSDVAYPEPSGPFVVGVHDFEILDTHYPVDRPEDEGGRRLMVRAWYPAAEARGQRRLYFEGDERAALAGPTKEVLAAYVSDLRVLDVLGDVSTHSYVDVPVADTDGSMPVIVFSHGGLGFVSQNTALMEEFASHGYLMLSVTHPGGSSGILYPNGDQVDYDPEYLQAVFTTGDPAKLYSDDIDIRFEGRKAILDDNGLGPWLPRWRDDDLAVVDFVEAGEADGLLGDILSQADASNVGYAGMSYGAAAAVSAAQVDDRAVAAFNLDGTHHRSDLLGTDIRVPLLTLSSEPAPLGVPYSNEFFFESFETMGDRADIVRAWVPGSTHLELSDNMFLPIDVRHVFPNGGQVDGTRVHGALVSFARGFFDAYLRGLDNGYPDASFESFPEVQPIDVSHIRTWSGSMESSG